VGIRGNPALFFKGIKMFARPTIMAATLLQAAIRKSIDAPRETPAGMIVNAALCDDPKRPMCSGYNRMETNRVNVSRSVLASTEATIR
jgi:hypothetical protein